MIASLFKYVEIAGVAVMITFATVSLNDSMKTGAISPDIVPLITLYEHDDKRIYPEVYQHEEDVLNETP